MRIAMVVTGGLHPSGTEQVVPSWLALFERLSRSHEVHAFVLRHLPTKQNYALRGFTVHDLGRPSGFFGLATRSFQQRALAMAFWQAGGFRAFDLVHGFLGDPAGQLAVREARRHGIPAVVTCDSGEFAGLPWIDYGSQRTARGRKAVAEACAGAARVHVCTQFMASLAALNGFETAVIPLTSDLASRPPAVDANEPSSSFRLLQVASLSRVKNQRMLIDAFAMVCERIDARLNLVGEDTLGGELQRYAAERGVADRVTFYGFLTQAQLAPLLTVADLYVQSSLHEAAGVSVLEAAAAGVPIAGTRVGYIADWAGARATAIDEPDPRLLADAILALHADPGRRRALADAARQWTREHDANATAARFEELYQTLHSRKKN